MRPDRPTLRAILLLGALSQVGGCIALHARVGVGPTITTDGVVGVQAGVAGGFGVPIAPRTALVLTPGLQMSTDRGPTVMQSFEVAGITDRVNYRAGLGTSFAAPGGSVSAFATGAVLARLSLRQRREGCAGKYSLFCLVNHRARSLGAQWTAGWLYDARRDAHHGQFGLALTHDWLDISQLPSNP